MNIGKARALFEQVASREYHGSTVGECLEAVKIILDMETHNSISKKMIMSVCKWLVEIAEKAVSSYRWIPVSERLPETTDQVLTTYIVNGDRSRKYVEESSYYKDDEYWCSPWDEYRKEGTRIEVIAWMPEPKAYKEGAKD